MMSSQLPYWTLNPMVSVLIKEREKTHIRKEMNEDRGSDLRDDSPSQGILRIAHSHRKLGKSHGVDSPSEAENCY